MKKNTIQSILSRASLLAAALSAPMLVTAAEPSSRPITLVVPFSAGSASDAYARLIGPKLATQLGRSVVVENREGAAGLIGAQAVLRAKPDGETLLLAASPWAYTPYFSKKPPYDPLKDFTAVAKVGVAPSVLVTGANVPFDSLEAMLAYARQNPGKLTYASSGVGSYSNLVGELLKVSAKVDILHVPYKSTAQAMSDVLSGQVTMSFSSLSPALPHINAKKMKALGVTSLQRAAIASAVPTIASAGMADFEANQWFGIVAPNGVPAEVVEQLNAKINIVLQDPEVAKRFESWGIMVEPKQPSAFSADIQKDIDKWVPLGKALNISYE